MKSSLALVAILMLIPAFLASPACAPLPPAEPPNLAGAKEALSQGHIWFRRGCAGEAARFYAEALELARLSDQPLLIVRAQNSLGAAALAGNDLDQAAAWLEAALETSLSLADQPDLDRVLGNFGALAYKAGKFAEAEEFWQKAILAASARTTNPAQYYCDLARLYLEHGPEEKLADATESALLAARKADSQEVQADALNLAGHLALKRGRHEEAQAAFNRALVLDRQTENTIGLAQDLEALGRLSLHYQRYQAAAGHFDRAFFLWAAAGDFKARDRVWAELQRLHQSQGRPKNLAVYEQARRDGGGRPISGRCP